MDRIVTVWALPRVARGRAGTAYLVGSRPGGRGQTVNMVWRHQ
jgi:hypothetical protein